MLRLPFILFILFLTLPIAEIVVMIQAAQQFGLVSVILACFATAIIGAAIIRWQGLGALNALRADMADGRSPAGPMIHGAFLLLAAPLLMTPGFITDTLGFLLLIPQVRVVLGRRALSWFRKKAETGQVHIR